MALTKRPKRVMSYPTNSDDEDGQCRSTSLSRAVKSKLAAKARRDQETVELASLCEELPFMNEALEKLDKSSLIRLAITYIQTKTFIQKEMCRNGYKGPLNRAIEGVTQISHQKNLLPEPGGRPTNGFNSHHQDMNIKFLQQTQPVPQLQLQPKQQQLQTQQQLQQHLQSQLQVEQASMVEEGKLMLESLQGFLIFVNKKGKVLYVAENVEEHLGLKQENLLGKPVMDIIHPGDVKELGKQFVIRLQKSNPADPSLHTDPVSASTGNILQAEQRRAFYIRMRYQLSKEGCKTKQSGFMLVQWLGRLKLRASSRSSGFSVEGLICICRPVQTQSILEIRLGGNMFMSRHDMDMKFTFCDPRILTLIGYEPSEVIGRTAYYFHNPLDAGKVSDCHSNLIVKGTSVSKYYRFFGKNGDWVWLQTRATVIYNTSSRPQYVVCMNYVIGEDEGQRYLMMEEEQKGIHDPNLRGLIDLNSYESPVSACSSGDESHDDTGYFSHSSHSTSPHNSSNITSPETLSSDERDSVLDDYPMSDEGQTESLEKEVVESVDQAVAVDQAVTAMSNGFDPFLSSFREELGLPGGSVEDGIDLLDDLLKSMEDEEMGQSQPAAKPPESSFFSPPGGKRQSLLRSLLDRGDNMSCKSFMDYKYSSVAPPASNSMSSTQAESNVRNSQPKMQSTTMSVGSKSDAPMETQSDPFIPEDLLEFAMQYCESIADEQPNGLMPTYDQDLWSSSMDDLITSLAETQGSTTSSSQSSPSSTATVTTSATQSSSNNYQTNYLDLDKVNTINKEHRYSCRVEDACASKQSNQASQKDGFRPSIFSALLTKDISTSPSLCSMFSDPQVMRSPASSKQRTASTCAKSQYPKQSTPISESQKQYSSSVCKNGQRFSNATSRSSHKSHKGVQTPPKNGKSMIKMVPNGCQRTQGSQSPTSYKSGSNSKTSTSTATSFKMGTAHGSQSITSYKPNSNLKPQPSTSFAMRSSPGPQPSTSYKPNSHPKPSTSFESRAAPSTTVLQGMSELEKYLRGYVDRPHASPQKQSLPCGSSMSSANTPFLQQLLTGELSHDVYRQIDSQLVRKERERRSSTTSISDVIG